MNTFPTTLNDWQDDDVIESAWADSLEAKVGADNSIDTSSHDYKIRALEASVNEELCSRTDSTTYTIAFEPVVASVRLFLNGFRLRRGSDYTLGGSNNQTITFINGVTVDVDSVLLADYNKII